MAISQKSVGAWAASNATTQTVTLPAHAAGDMIIVRAGCKPFNADPVINTAGWTAVNTAYANGASANGNGTGSVIVRAWYKEATSSSETNPVITWNTTSAPGGAVAVVYQKGAGEGWSTPVGAGGGDDTARTSQTATISSHIPVTAGDMVDFFVVTRDDSVTTVPTITQTGVTFAAVTEYPATALASATSNDAAFDGGYRLATAGTSSAAAVVTHTNAATESGAAWQTRLRVFVASFTPATDAFRFYEDGTESGSSPVAAQNADIERDVTTDSSIGLRVRIQETGGAPGAATDDYQLQFRLNGGTWTNTGTGAVLNHASANLTDGGTTTNRLSAGTGSFVAGEVSEDGLVDDRQLTGNNYTEHLYALTLSASATAAGDGIQFRTLLNGAVMTNIVTPVITVTKTVAKNGSDSTQISSSETANVQEVPSIVGAHGNNNGSVANSNPRFTMPAGVQNGDKCYVWLTYNTAAAILSDGSNWTGFSQVGSDLVNSTVLTSHLFVKTLDGTEAGQSTGPTTDAGKRWTMSAIVVRNGSLDQNTTVQRTLSTATTAADPDPVTPTEDHELIVTYAAVRHFVVNETGTFTPPSNYVEQTDTAGNSTNANNGASIATIYLSGGAGVAENPGAFNYTHDVDRQNMWTLSFALSASDTPVSSNDATEISSSETSAIASSQTSTDSTQITSAETSAILSTRTQTDTTQITSAETAAIQSTLSRTDATEISSSETAAVVVQISSADSTQITSAEAQTTLSTLNRPDSTLITSTDASSFATVAFTRTDTTQITSTDVGTTTAQFPGADNTIISSAETASVLVLISSSDSTQISSTETASIASSQTSTDTTQISSSETAAILSTLTRTDTTQITSSETTSFAQVNFTRTDATDIGSAETSSIMSSLSRPDTTNITSTETAAIASSQSNADTTQISSSETASIQSSQTTTDATQISSSETASVVVAISSADATQITGTDVGTTTAQFPGSDSTLIGSSETSDVQISGLVEKTSNDSTQITSTDASSPLVSLNRPDTTEISSSETSTIASSLSRTDTTQITSTETSAIASSLNRTDATQITGTDASSFATVAFTRTDSTEVTSADSSVVFVNNPGADATVIGSSETADIQISGGAEISGSDSTQISSSETASLVITRFVTSDDTTQITGTDAGTFATVAFSSSDSTQVTSADSGLPFVNNPGADSTVISSTETADVQVSGGNNVSSNDSTEITGSETSSLAITRFVSSADSTEITSTDTSSFATVIRTASDATQIASAETASSQGTVTATDATQIVSSDLGIPNAQIPGADTTIISTVETATIEQIGTVQVSSSDSTQISSADVAITNVSIARSDATQITAIETALSLGTVVSHDTTQITSVETRSFNTQPITSQDSTQIGSTETTNIFILIAITSSDFTEITSVDVGFVGEMDIGEVSSRATTDTPGAGVQTDRSTRSHVGSAVVTKNIGVSSQEGNSGGVSSS